MKGCLRCADWIEHVIATGGEPYLRTPDNEMSLVVRNSLDVYTVIVAMCCLALGSAHMVLRSVLRRCKAVHHVRNSNKTRLHAKISQSGTPNNCLDVHTVAATCS